ncbi:hypothetical protein ACFZBU_46580 [Embleya sp. NPDC008237]|uniref:hypothetical protein n=1 Tax=Embleya sp. NPDC008237 TaxID=3363978 RepID=UPI0036E207E4
MSDDIHRTTRTELLGKFWLSGQLTCGGVEIANPTRDMGVDLIAYDAGLTWSLPIQLKVINSGGLRVDAKYLRKNLCLVYVLLGQRDGGNLATRAETVAYVLTPEQAWALPSRIGRKFDPERDNYYLFGRMPKRLFQLLDSEFRVDCDRWAERLGAVAPLVRVT